MASGGSENAEVTKSLFSDLITRGLKTDCPRLYVLDGGKALHKAVRDTFGVYAVIQRCQVHKTRNVLSHLPKSQREGTAETMAEAYKQEEFDVSKAKLVALAEELKKYPSAAHSLLEALDETLTVNLLD
jgi:transposase-like protein